MHELSIAHSLVELAGAAAEGEGARKVRSLNLVVGALSCVSPEALDFCFELASKDSALEGASLRIRRLPVVIHCTPCNRDVELPGIQSFRCPHCGTPSSDIRQGRELEIESLELEIEENKVSPAVSDSQTPDAEPYSATPERAILVS